jgi:hypothetical protein
MEKYQKPESSKGDVVHAIARAGFSAVPVAGGALTELLNAVIMPPLMKRKDEWIELIAQGLKTLESKVENFKIENLAQNEAFITIVSQASQSAIRNHQVEKLEALRNAVLNSAMPNAPDENEQLMFLGLVDRFTPWHLKILQCLHEPKSFAVRRNIVLPDWGMGGKGTVLETCIPELKGRRDFYDLIGKELYAAGLIGTNNFHVTMTGGGMIQSATTPFGSGFLTFIEAPI